MNNKVLALVVIILVAVGAWLLLFSKPAVSVEELMENKAEAISKTDAVSMNILGNLNIASTSDGQDFNFKIPFSAVNKVDAVKQLTYLKVNTTIPTFINAQLAGPIELEMYSTDDKIYIGSNGVWATQENTGEVVDFSKLSDGAEPKITGGEKLDGKDVVVVEYEVDNDKLFGGIGELGIVEEMPESTREVTIKEWVSKETSLPVKSEMRLTVVMDGSSLSLNSVVTYDYGPINIVIPDEAKESVPLTEFVPTTQ